MNVQVNIYKMSVQAGDPGGQKIDFSTHKGQNGVPLSNAHVLAPEMKVPHQLLLQDYSYSFYLKESTHTLSISLAISLARSQELNQDLLCKYLGPASLACCLPGCASLTASWNGDWSQDSNPGTSIWVAGVPHSNAKY